MRQPPPNQTVQTKNSQTGPHICIVGGGFGGLYTALYLQKYRHLRNSRITLIEPRDHFLFTPMMYELITDELKVWEIAPTYSSLLMGTHIIWHQTHAETVDLQQQIVTVTSGQSLSYDYLVVARGADSRPVDIPGVHEYALNFRTLQDALALKARLAQLVSAQAIQAGNGHIRPIYVTVIGGGASGVELAGKVADYLAHYRSHHTHHHPTDDSNTGHGKASFFHSDADVSAQITLVERGPTILKPFAKGLRRLGQKALAKRHIRILTETSVVSVEAESVTVQQGNQQQTLASHLTLWAVGTQPRPWLGQQTVAHNHQGQRLTRRSLQLIDYDNVFVLGDAAEVRDKRQQLAPNTAQAAFQAASRVAANLAAMTQGNKPRPFNYLHLGDMITLGIGDAGLWSFGIVLGGKLAALCRRGVYIFRMPTHRHQRKVARRALSMLLPRFAGNLSRS
ncbi:MAG: NAD(P)/FAD-dependent oxidoreductase [Phormidesmis sp. RL_2_1]|nr:NAD(P)/FAD-dependent oxidoreductase [Phormidesmis sp. RL_2_1]